MERNVPANESPRFSSSRSRVKAATSCRRTASSRGCAQLCDKHGILLIFDEVQAGIGRTGKMFAWQHWGVKPDIITLAKGIGSGLPIGLAVASQAVMEQVGAGRACEYVRRQSAVLCGGAWRRSIS